VMSTCMPRGGSDWGGDGQRGGPKLGAVLGVTVDGGGSAAVGTVVGGKGGGEGGEGGGREDEGGSHSTEELNDESAVITRNASSSAASSADFPADSSANFTADCPAGSTAACAFLIGHRMTTGASPWGWWPTTTARTPASANRSTARAAGRCGCPFTRYEEHTTVGDFVKSGCVSMP
jgi:hypothetical protein